MKITPRQVSETMSVLYSYANLRTQIVDSMVDAEEGDISMIRLENILKILDLVAYGSYIDEPEMWDEIHSNIYEILS